MEEHLQISITYRPLTSEEIFLLNTDIKNFPDLKYVSEKNWKRFGDVFVARLKGEFAGVCVANRLDKWCKIGPIVVLEKFQGYKVSSALFSEVLTKLKGYRFYITSSNDSVIHLAKKFGFEEKSIFKLPREIYSYIIINLYKWLLDWTFWKEYLRKKNLYRIKSHRHFVKY